ncbi:MAG TPA: chemotaxis protein CheB [Longimicrobiaceae bacterium]|nr:chemotaxis protein CheB [Longimicrobiaceae bacterium]
MKRDIIVVGASAGGVAALRTLAAGLPAGLDASVFVVMHVAADGPGFLPQILQGDCALPVEHARDGEPIAPGRVYVAPADHHLVLERDRVRVTRGPRENMSRPAIDPLFRSAAYFFGPRVVGVILTGRLDDGTAGLWAVKRRGGAAVVQDPEEALYPSMPRSALRHVEVDGVARVSDLAPLLVRLTREPPAEEEPAASEALEVETRIAVEDNALQAGVMKLGPLTPFTCPECHGVLVSVGEGGVPRFRCHTGHAYSMESLLTAVSDSMEDTLWSAIRSMEEGMLMLRHVARHVRENGQDERGAEAFERKAREAERYSELVRRAVTRQEALGGELARGP